MDKRTVLGGETASSRDPVMSRDLSARRGLFVGLNPITNKRNPSVVVYVYAIRMAMRKAIILYPEPSELG